MNQEKYLEVKALRRWSLVDSQNAKLLGDCTVWKSEFPSPTTAFGAYPAAKVKLSPGESVTYEDNLGLDSATQRRIGEPLPQTDEFWCKQTVSGGSRIAGLECLEVLGAQPAATLDSVELIDQYSNPEFPEIVSSGFRAKLTILGSGPITLGVPSTCPHGFPFSFTALVIEP